jgi:hypothetical protein
MGVKAIRAISYSDANEWEDRNEKSNYSLDLQL